MFKKLVITAAVLCQFVSQAWAEDAIIFNTTPASGPYCILFDDTDNTKADFVEGSGSKVGRFVVTSDDLDADDASLNSSATPYTGRIYASTASALVVADLTPVGIVSNFLWDGSSVVTIEEQIEELATGTTISPFSVDEGHTWRFESSDQTTAKPTIREVVGFDALVAMDFSRVIPANTTANTVTVVAVSPDTGLETGAIAVTPNKRGMHLPVEITEANTYIVTIQIITVDNQKFRRKGRLIATAVSED